MDNGKTIDLVLREGNANEEGIKIERPVLALRGRIFNTYAEDQMRRMQEKAKAKKAKLLLRFREGTEIDFEALSRFGEIKWSFVFIPVVGLEVEPEKYIEALEAAEKMPGFVRAKDVVAAEFHPYSFLFI